MSCILTEGSFAAADIAAYYIILNACTMRWI